MRHGGSYATLKEARARRDLIAGELAAGRNPADVLLSPEPTRTLATVYEKFRVRPDVSEGTRRNYRSHWNLLAPALASAVPERVKPEDVQAWVNAQTLAPGTLNAYLGTLPQLLDFARVEPNPARSKWVKLPRAESEVSPPPDNTHVVAMLNAMKPERRMLFAFMERCGIRVSETCGWEWPDVDVENSRIRSRAEVQKGRRGTRKPRWVPLPEFLLSLLLEQTPYDDRGGPLFPWVRRYEHPGDACRKVMRRACQAAGIPHFHPHDLRHRRASLWHLQGMPLREIGDRLGQRSSLRRRSTPTAT